jgi:ribosomal protein S18 acetylase RimI-like enzyme
VTSVRRARLDDIDEIIRLRVEMFRSMDIEMIAVETWAPAVRDFVTANIDNDRVFIAVIDGIDGHLQAIGVLQILDRLGSPRFPRGKSGYISSVSVDPSAKRQGLGKAIMESIKTYAQAAGVERLELHASSEGELLYTQLGYDRRSGPEYRLAL